MKTQIELLEELKILEKKSDLNYTDIVIEFCSNNDISCITEPDSYMWNDGTEITASWGYSNNKYGGSTFFFDFTNYEYAEPIDWCFLISIEDYDNIIFFETKKELDDYMYNYYEKHFNTQKH